MARRTSCTAVLLALLTAAATHCNGGGGTDPGGAADTTGPADAHDAGSDARADPGTADPGGPADPGPGDESKTDEIGGRDPGGPLDLGPGDPGVADPAPADPAAADPGVPDPGTADPGAPADPGPGDPGIADLGPPDPGQPDAGPPLPCDHVGILEWGPVADTRRNLAAAKAFCESQEGGWRVPTICELRSLLDGCPDSDAPGDCAVDETGCTDFCGGNCSGCPLGAGPGTNGCYVAPTEAIPCGFYWSSTPHKSWANSIWVIDLERAFPFSTAPTGNLYIRCVR